MKTYAKFKSNNGTVEIDTDEIQDIAYFQSSLWVYTLSGKRYPVHGPITFITR